MQLDVILKLHKKYPNKEAQMQRLKNLINQFGDKHIESLTKEIGKDMKGKKKFQTVTGANFDVIEILSLAQILFEGWKN